MSSLQRAARPGRPVRSLHRRKQVTGWQSVPPAGAEQSTLPAMQWWNPNI